MPPTLAPERISVESTIIDEAQETSSRPDLADSALTLVQPDGTSVPLPEELQSLVFQALASLGQNGSVSIGHMPDELTSTVAADTLGVSRPTLMKWAKDGTIASHKVGTHTRFRRDDVLALREQRREVQRKALEELRAIDDEFED